MPSIELWIDGVELFDCCGWKEEIVFDFERFQSDDRYAAMISDHISRSLQNLVKEVQEIGVVTPVAKEVVRDRFETADT